jgi:hypothetical protein
MAHRFDPTILREYDIRGIVGATLFAADARALGRVFAQTIAAAGGRRVAVGYDGRLTSPELEAALVEGLAEGGAGSSAITRGLVATKQSATKEKRRRINILFPRKAPCPLPGRSNIPRPAKDHPRPGQALATLVSTPPCGRGRAR